MKKVIIYLSSVLLIMIFGVYQGKSIMAEELPLEYAKIWDQVYGGSQYEYFNSIIQTSDGGYVAVGYTFSSRSGEIFDINNGGSDGLLVKFDANGRRVWDQVYGGSQHETFYDVVETSNGGLMVVGDSTSSASGEIKSISSTINSESAMIVKFDANGKYISDKFYGNYYGNVFYDIIKTRDGGYMVSGLMETSNLTYKGVGMKLNSIGDYQWKILFGDDGCDTRFRSAVETKDGGFAFVGSSDSTGTKTGYNYFTDKSNGYLDGVVVKVNSSGKVLWNKLHGGAALDIFSSVLESPDGSLIAGGRTYNEDIYSNIGELPARNYVGFDGMLVKFDTLGNTLWSKVYGGANHDEFYKLVFDKDKNILAIGNTKSQYFDDRSTDGLVSLFNSVDGSIIWAKGYGSTVDEYFLDALYSEKRELVCVGQTSGTGIDGDITDKRYSGNDGLLMKVTPSILRVQYVENGGSLLEDYDIIANTKAVEPQAPTRNGYKFLGWYTDSAFTKPYIWTNNVTGDVTLYANWANGMTYRGYISGSGWQNWKTSSTYSGIGGKYLESFVVDLVGYPGDIGVKYQSYVSGTGWQTWKIENETSGTIGKRIEMMRMSLTGTEASKYDLYYRVYTKAGGWLDWGKNGQAAGFEGKNLGIEAYQVKIVPKGTTGYITTNHLISAYGTGALRYNGYIYGLGWQGWKKDGAYIGIAGKALQAYMIRLGVDTTDGLVTSGGISYQSYVAGIGWQSAKSNGTYSGIGGKRLETVKINLTGAIATKYDVYYRVYVRGIGWMGWTKNGLPAGTNGYGYSVEAMAVKLVIKGGAAPGGTIGSYRQK